MSSTKRRRRTGCLTCRARHVKCDEQRPGCERCNAANITCAGYEKARHVEVRRPRSRHTTAQPSVAAHSRAAIATPDLASPLLSAAPTNQKALSKAFPPRFREDGLPLVALPVNPHEDYRPHNGARPVLAYHQYLFRTLPLLFPRDHEHFWGDRLCDAAWEVEYVFDTITALGSMHRAALLLSTPREIDRHRGLDTQVMATQAYVKVLQRLAASLEEAEKSPDILVAVLILLTYFECFAGNHLAARGHLRLAVRYFGEMLADSAQQKRSCMTPIGDGLQALQHTLRIVLPFPDLITVPSHPTSVSMMTWAQSAAIVAPGPDLRRLVALLFVNDAITDMVWASWRLRDVTGLEEKISSFQRQLRDWKSRNCQSLPLIEPEGTEADASPSGWYDLVIPPPSVPSATPRACLASALYCFAMARTMWAKSQLGIEEESHEQSAYVYFYQTMRFATTISDIAAIPGEDLHLPCEMLHVGLLPVLHITGQCSPTPVWRRWIVQHIKHIGQEGVFHGPSLAINLEMLHNMEMDRDQNESLAVQGRYPTPASRVVSVLIPEADGCHYTSYYAGVRRSTGPGGSSRILYCPIGHARWTKTGPDGEAQPQVTGYAGMQTTVVSTASDWLRIQAPVRGWVDWADSGDSSIDSLLRDHILGGELTRGSWTPVSEG